MLHPTKTNEMFEITGDKLRAIVTDHPWLSMREFLPCPLQNGFNICFRHDWADFPVNDVATVPIYNRTLIIERATDIDVGDVNVPMLVRLLGLMKTRAFLGRLGRCRPQQTRGTQYPIDAAGTNGGNLLVQHHVGQTAISNLTMVNIVVDDGRLFLLSEPMLFGLHAVGLIFLPLSADPIVVFAAADTQPVGKHSHIVARLALPCLYKCHDFIPRLSGNPCAR